MTAPAIAGSIGARVMAALDLTVTVPNGNGTDFADFAGLALRNNPRRAHLIVSRLLGKHIPTDPNIVLEAAHALADNVAALLTEPLGTDGLVLGYCETATALGHGVAARLHASYLHTTRKENPDVPVAARFDEEHSHAVAHLLQPAGNVTLAGTGPLVLVDDELTSGKTALNTLAALHERWPRPLYVIATLLDARTPEARQAFEQAVAASGLNVQVASLLDAYLHLPADILDRAQQARQDLPASAPQPVTPQGHPGAPVIWHSRWWPETLPVTARHGMTTEQTRLLHRVAGEVATGLRTWITDSDANVLVLGTEELMYAPQIVASRLAALLPDGRVRTQSTTRSPVHAADDPSYAIRRTVTFTAPDDPTRQSLVHNLTDPAETNPNGPWSDLRADHIVVLVDEDMQRSTDLARALRPYANTHVHMVTTATHVTPEPATKD